MFFLLKNLNSNYLIFFINFNRFNLFILNNQMQKLLKIVLYKYNLFFKEELYNYFNFYLNNKKMKAHLIPKFFFKFKKNLNKLFTKFFLLKNYNRFFYSSYFIKQKNEVNYKFNYLYYSYSNFNNNFKIFKFNINIFNYFIFKDNFLNLLNLIINASFFGYYPYFFTKNFLKKKIKIFNFLINKNLFFLKKKFFSIKYNNKLKNTLQGNTKIPFIVVNIDLLNTKPHFINIKNLGLPIVSFVDDNFNWTLIDYPILVKKVSNDLNFMLFNFILQNFYLGLNLKREYDWYIFLKYFYFNYFKYLYIISKLH